LVTRGARIGRVKLRENAFRRRDGAYLAASRRRKAGNRILPSGPNEVVANCRLTALRILRTWSLRPRANSRIITDKSRLGIMVERRTGADQLKSTTATSSTNNGSARIRARPLRKSSLCRRFCRRSGSIRCMLPLRPWAESGAAGGEGLRDEAALSKGSRLLWDLFSMPTGRMIKNGQNR
jgi:hypothetical protein